MTKTSPTIADKLLRLEGEVEELKRTVRKAPDLEADNRAWKGIKKTAKKVRGRVFERDYGRKKKT